MVILDDWETQKFEMELERELSAKMKWHVRGDPALEADLLQTLIEFSLEEGQSYDPGSGFVKTEVAMATGFCTKIQLVDDKGRVPMLIQELREMIYSQNQKWGSRTEPHNVAFLSRKDKERTREIGDELNKIGGFDLMLAVCDRVSMVERESRRSLELAWDGIGSWQG